MAYTTYQDVFNMTGLTSNDIDTSIVEDFIDYADAYIKEKLRKTYDTPSLFTDYFDTQENPYHIDWEDEGGIITGKKPFWNSRHRFKLKWSPVTKIQNVWILEKGKKIDAVYSYYNSSYTDNTDNANQVGEDLFYPFSDSPSVGDYLYIGCDYKFLSVFINLAVDGAGGTCEWEYYNGSSWTSLSVSTDTTNADNLLTSGKIYWDKPSDWETTTTINGYEYYWVRIKVTGTYTTAPKIENMYFGQDDVIQEELNPYQYNWYTNGIVLLRDSELSSEARYVRIDYYAGATSVPTLVKELSTVLASISSLIMKMGGSFDDAVSYSLGSLQVSKGEPYAQLRMTALELMKRRDELFKKLGVNVVIITT